MADISAYLIGRPALSFIMALSPDGRFKCCVEIILSIQYHPTPYQDVLSTAPFGFYHVILFCTLAIDQHAVLLADRDPEPRRPGLAAPGKQGVAYIKSAGECQFCAGLYTLLAEGLK